MRRFIPAVLVLSVVLAGCESTKNPYDPPKPLDKMSKEELCSYYVFFLTDPKLSQQTRTIATQKMRDKGCPSA